MWEGAGKTGGSFLVVFHSKPSVRVKTLLTHLSTKQNHIRIDNPYKNTNPFKNSYLSITHATINSKLTEELHMKSNIEKLLIENIEKYILGHLISSSHRVYSSHTSHMDLSTHLGCLRSLSNSGSTNDFFYIVHLFIYYN